MAKSPCCICNVYLCLVALATEAVVSLLTGGIGTSTGGCACWM